MRLDRVDEDGFVQYDGDEPGPNREYVQHFNVGSREKRAEHEDTLRGEYRTDNSERVVDAIEDHLKKTDPERWEARERRLGEVTAAAKIPSEKIKGIIDLLQSKERAGYVIYDVDGSPTDTVADWKSAIEGK